MTPAEIAERLQELADQVAGIVGNCGPATDLADVVTSLRMIGNHALALADRRLPVASPDTTWFRYPAVMANNESRHQHFTGPKPDRELSLMAHVVDLEATGDLDRRSVGRMAEWIMERFGGDPDA